MRLFATILCFFLFLKTGHSQDLVKQIDSFVRVNESFGTPVLKIRCDTPISLHTDYFVSICMEYYSTENKFIRIVEKTDRFKVFNYYDSTYGQKPMKTGTIYIDTFYYHRDTLIKAIRANYDRPPLSVVHFYFTGIDLAYLEERGWKASADYKQAEFCIGLANELLDYFKKNK